MGSAYNMIPMATQAAGTNNQGGVQQPFGGSGMDVSKAQGILDPLGIGGGGGMNKSSAEAFLDPAGIDSGPYGLNLFGHRPNPNAGAMTLPNLGANTLIPQTPMGHFTMQGFGSGPFNQMVAQSVGGRFVPTYSPGHPFMPTQSYTNPLALIPSPMMVHNNQGKVRR